jgi:hypothetical protein
VTTLPDIVLRRYQQHGTRATRTSGLNAGDIVVWDDKPHRIQLIAPLPPCAWPEDYHTRWHEDGHPELRTWLGLPYAIVVRHEPDNDAAPIRLIGPARAAWTVLPEHYTVCRLCAELPPCRHVRTEAEIAHATAQLEAALALAPGTCHGCGQPITARHKTIVFEGPNLINPALGDDSAAFHNRRTCTSAAEHYDAQWAAAAPGRRRKLSCDGTRREGLCSRGTDCPGDVRHPANEPWNLLTGESHDLGETSR